MGMAGDQGFDRNAGICCSTGNPGEVQQRRRSGRVLASSLHLMNAACLEVRDGRESVR
jgi:hypothetical protein